MKKKRIVQLMSFMMIFALAVTALMHGGPIRTQAVPETYIGDGDLTLDTVADPTPDEVVPNAEQYKYQKDELSAFCHFGPNTFSGLEWGWQWNYNTRQGIWYYKGKPINQVFPLTKAFEADKLVNTLDQAGFKKLLVTAKHHDGFCIWRSQYTNFGIKDTNYQGDVLKELSAACTNVGMDMGLYLSPWDVDSEHFGADGGGLDNAYNDYYNNQLEEILGNDDYGNAGHFVEVWMDGANGYDGKLDIPQKYDFTRWFDTIQKNEGIASGKYETDCMLFGAGRHTTVRWIGNERGEAADVTWSKSKVTASGMNSDPSPNDGFTNGFEDGNCWTVPEADARITDGWFWGSAKSTPKTLEDLGDMYFNSVGHNAVLLLNVPPNNQGGTDAAILKRVEEFGQNIRDSFAVNLAAQEGAEVRASAVRADSRTYRPGNVIDGRDETYWTTPDGTNTGTLLIDLGKETKFDVVSIEEAIQLGQRINSYKIEYRNGASGEWSKLEEGVTIGAKRLARIPETTATQIRITVSVPEGKVPILSEVGVYKMTKAFEISSIIPKGMEVIDITDNDLSDGTGFTMSGKWNYESGSKFINGTGKWANTGAGLTLKFHGTKVWLLGTVDPGHGRASISIDGGPAQTINTYAGSRDTKSILFQSGDLTDTEHTLTLTILDKAVGIGAAMAINNGGAGMIGFEADSYTMEENTTMNVKVVRVGGSKGRLTAVMAPNPGSAVQDSFDTGLIHTVVLEEGETEKSFPVRTLNNPNKTGDLWFGIELSSTQQDIILGLNRKATVTIRDAEGFEATADSYTEEAPFLFPTEVGGTPKVLEAEHFQLRNAGPANERWKLQIATNQPWASNNQFVNCLNTDDQILLFYRAEKAGTYEVTVTFRSGDPLNALRWQERNGKIEPGTKVAGASDGAAATHTETFTLKVLQAGDGALVFTGPAKNSPQLDKFDVKLTEISVETRPLILVAKPEQLSYEVNAELAVAGMKLAVKKDGVMTEVGTESCKITYDFSNPGKAKVSLSHTGEDGILYKNVFTVNVWPPREVRQIVLAGKPARLSYAVGEEPVLDGLTVLVKYSDGSTAVVSAEQLTVSGYVPTQTGVQRLTVKYGDFSQTTSFSVRVS